MKDSERRTYYRQSLSPLYLPYYDKLCELLPPLWQPYYGMRSMDLQEALYAKGRTTPGPTVTNAPAGASAHNYGCASDWTLFSNETALWPGPKDPRWEQYADTCDEIGLQWGGNFKNSVDYYHNEVKLTCSWTLVKEAYSRGGMKEALAFIETSMVK